MEEESGGPDKRDYDDISVVKDYDKYVELRDRPDDWSEKKAKLGIVGKGNSNMEPLGQRSKGRSLGTGSKEGRKRQGSPICYELEEIMRTKNKEFAKILHRIRNIRHLKPQKSAENLSQSSYRQQNNNDHCQASKNDPDYDPLALHIFYKNAEVNEQNQFALDLIEQTHELEIITAKDSFDKQPPGCSSCSPEAVCQNCENERAVATIVPPENLSAMADVKEEEVFEENNLLEDISEEEVFVENNLLEGRGRGL